MSDELKPISEGMKVFKERIQRIEEGNGVPRRELLDRLEERVKSTPRIEGWQGRERSYTLETWRKMGFMWQEEGLSGLEALISGAVRNLWLWSANPGTGKTGFAIVCAREWQQVRSGSVRLVRMASVSSMEFGERNRLARECAENAGLVIVDDFHRLRFSAEHNLEWLHEFMDGLYRERVSVLATANGSFKSVQTVATTVTRDYAAAFDRLRDGGLHEIEATGASRRA